jgi:Calcium binding
MTEGYDSSWDESGNEEAWERKYREWKNRDWNAWLKDTLSFPFEARREEDEDGAYFTDVVVVKTQPFGLGHVFKVIGIEYDDAWTGIIMKAQEGRNTGYVPLCDVEVTTKSDKNYWPVREYVVWFANRS